jgi:hypothetical protein
MNNIEVRGRLLESRYRESRKLSNAYDRAFLEIEIELRRTWPKCSNSDHDAYVMRAYRNLLGLAKVMCQEWPHWFPNHPIYMARKAISDASDFAWSKHTASLDRLVVKHA